MELLKKWTIDRKSTEAHRENVIIHMTLAYGEAGIDLLPPIYSVPINELSNDEIRLLDNLNHIFFKGEFAGSKI